MEGQRTPLEASKERDHCRESADWRGSRFRFLAGPQIDKRARVGG